MKQECIEKNKNKIYKGDILSLQLTITNNEFINRSLVAFGGTEELANPKSTSILITGHKSQPERTYTYRTKVFLLYRI